MQKTKLGISVGLLGACVCLATLFSGYLAAIVLVGYILLFEENEWLKKNSVKALAFGMMITLVTYVIGLIPDLLSWFNSVFRVFNGSFNYGFTSSIITVINGALDIIEKCVLMLMGVKALKLGTVNIPVVDNVVNKYF